MARGTYIARMDADDLSLSSRLAVQIEYLESHPDCVCVGSNIELIDDRGRKLTVWHQLTSDSEIQREAMKGHGTICHPTAMIRRTAMDKLGGYRTEMYPAEDLDLWLRLGEIGSLANINQVLLRYRMHVGSVSAQAARTSAQRLAAERCCADAARRRGLAYSQFSEWEDWRSNGTASAEMAFDLRYGWWAFNSKEYSTAADYGLRAWRRSPLSREAFILWMKSLLRSYSGRNHY
jgi:hypothetical protein